MNLQEFARGMVKEGAWGATALRTGKRIWGGLSGGTVKRLEGRVAKASTGDLGEATQKRLGRLSELLPKAKTYQKNVRVGAGLAGGGLAAGYMLGNKKED